MGFPLDHQRGHLHDGGNAASNLRRAYLCAKAAGECSPKSSPKQSLVDKVTIRTYG
jgi:hypothetical protein